MMMVMALTGASAHALSAIEIDFSQVPKCSKKVKSMALEGDLCRTKNNLMKIIMQEDIDSAIEKIAERKESKKIERKEKQKEKKAAKKIKSEEITREPLSLSASLVLSHSELEKGKGKPLGDMDLKRLQKAYKAIDRVLPMLNSDETLECSIDGKRAANALRTAAKNIELACAAGSCSHSEVIAAREYLFDGIEKLDKDMDMRATSIREAYDYMRQWRTKNAMCYK